MSSKLFILLTLFLIANTLYSLDFNKTFQGTNGSVAITDDLTISMNLNDPSIHISGNFSITYENQLTFIHIEDQKFLCLYSDKELILYNSEGDPLFAGIYGSSNLKEMYGPFNEFSSSSFLIEGTTQYSAANLRNLSTFSPWVEDGNGQGIGEWIDLEYESSGFGKLSGLLIYNGFISNNKPYLYTKNSRIRTLDVYDHEGSFLRRIELSDTPNPQYFKLLHPTDRIRLEIKSVYPGTDWSDTCLNTVYAVPERMRNFFQEDMSKSERVKLERDRDVLRLFLEGDQTRRDLYEFGYKPSYRDHIYIFSNGSMVGYLPDVRNDDQPKYHSDLKHKFLLFFADSPG